MRFLHLSDLHLGKKIYEFSMIEDQKYILDRIIEIIDREEIDAVLICGDVYDKSVPPREAVLLFDDFLTRLLKRELPVCIISGNHDSPERLSFGNQIMKNSRIFFSPVYDGKTEPIQFKDEFGKVFVYMLPFVKPANVRPYFPKEKIESYTEAIQCGVQGMYMDHQNRNILMTHQFVAGASRCDSESFTVGGTDNVSPEVFDGIDYVALGHLHSPQKVGRATIRYSGTPIQYSFSESGQEKSVTIVEMKEKGNVELKTVPLKPLRKMRELIGTYEELMEQAAQMGKEREDYLLAVLKDEEEVFSALDRLRTVYPNVMSLRYDNIRTQNQIELGTVTEKDKMTEMEIFRELYEKVNGQEMSEAQEVVVKNILDQLSEGKS